MNFDIIVVFFYFRSKSMSPETIHKLSIKICLMEPF